MACLREFRGVNITMENAYKSISEPLDFKIFFLGGGGACTHTPLEARAFGTQNLPHLVR